jgi:GAF domain-containing protein
MSILEEGPIHDSRKVLYESLTPQWMALIDAELNMMANLANLSAAISAAFQWHWVGFYLVDTLRDELVLGPFQGPVACTRLHHGKGVCAAAWDTKKEQVIDDVQDFPGHVACSALSISELVLPIVVGGEVVAVLDIDSSKPADFSADDVDGFKAILNSVSSKWNHWE